MGKRDDIGKKVDRFVMGALIGGAIGSVLGMAFAPKKGKETRKTLKEKSEKLLKKTNAPEVQKFKKGIAEEGKQIFNIVKDKIEEIKEERELAKMVDHDESRKIPHEE